MDDKNNCFTLNGVQNYMHTHTKKVLYWTKYIRIYILTVVIFEVIFPWQCQVSHLVIVVFFFFFFIIIQCVKACAIPCPHQPPTRVITVLVAQVIVENM